jgi:hypothetical protein
MEELATAASKSEGTGFAKEQIGHIQVAFDRGMDVETRDG